MDTPVTVIVVAKDEQRCIGRCLDSVAGLNVLVVDTGSTDQTPGIIADRGVRLVHQPWPGSFAEARNGAIDLVQDGWIFFLDADEWLADRNIHPLLASAARTYDPSRTVFAPVIQHVGRDTAMTDVPRIFLASSGIRYHGRVHEYPVASGPLELVGLGIQVNHDGYHPDVLTEKDKLTRNLELLRAARQEDPDNPRWWYFTVRDGLRTYDRDQLVDLCAASRDLAKRSPVTGDRLDAVDYYRRTLFQACQAFAMMQDWNQVLRSCAELDRVHDGDSPDAHYLRMVTVLFNDAAAAADLVKTIQLRRASDNLATSVIDPTGRHLDAVIVALLARLRTEDEADQYRRLSKPWTDLFFENSHLRALHDT
ncbi:glycosyltransferase [Fodinicola acaciae]|uniref:glycosyltransferase n=1 Tax=Fodinicola acaciae TaxID=2681555 RepID=UPI0013D54290|nr:glycosyltransferase [Fodinicola acaciae]